MVYKKDYNLKRTDRKNFQFVKKKNFNIFATKVDSFNTNMSCMDQTDVFTLHNMTHIVRCMYTLYSYKVYTRQGGENKPFPHTGVCPVGGGGV